MPSPVGARIETDQVFVPFGLTVSPAASSTKSGPPKRSPPSKAQRYPALFDQVVVPVLRTVQLFSKLAPAANRVPSGTVSETKLAPSSLPGGSTMIWAHTWSPNRPLPAWSMRQ